MQFPGIETSKTAERASPVLISLLWGGKSEINQLDRWMANKLPPISMITLSGKDLRE